MKSESYFHIRLASLIAPENYKQEFLRSKKLLTMLKELYPELSEIELEESIIFSYAFHNEPLSIRGRLEYIKVLFFLNQDYSTDFYDVVEKKEERIFNYRRKFGGKISKYAKLAIAEITYEQHLEQIREDAELMLSLPKWPFPC